MFIVINSLREMLPFWPKDQENESLRAKEYEKVFSSMLCPREKVSLQWCGDIATYMPERKLLFLAKIIKKIQEV
jgi:hypothetical protein